MPSNIAAVTMTYNEKRMLPLWLRYYCGNFGPEACYVIDHGSTDGSTRGLEANVVRIPRSPMNDKKRARFISRFCSALLEWYDAVIYTDADEFLVPDPAAFSSLRHFCESTAHPVTTAIGMNVQHVPALEGKLQGGIPILRQRGWARFNFAMCKPLITRVPIEWTPGFHSSDQATEFDRLFMFHLHNFDLDCALERLAKTRSMQWEGGASDNHQRWSDERYRDMFMAIANLPRMESATFEPADPHIAKMIRWMEEFRAANPDKRHLFYSENGVPCNELMRIPERFLDSIENP